MSANSKPDSPRQLLIRASRPENDAPFTCEECFVAFEYYVDGIVAGTDADKLRRLIRRHLDYCPDCYKKHADLLETVLRTMPQTLEQEIVDLEARLAGLEARLPAHSIPPAMIMEMDELEEQLIDKRARLSALQHPTTG